MVWTVVLKVKAASPEFNEAHKEELEKLRVLLRDAEDALINFTLSQLGQIVSEFIQKWFSFVYNPVMAGQPKYVDVPWQALFADVMTVMKEGSQRIISSFDEKSPALGELSQQVSAVRLALQGISENLPQLYAAGSEDAAGEFVTLASGSSFTSFRQNVFYFTNPQEGNCRSTHCV